MNDIELEKVNKEFFISRIDKVLINSKSSEDILKIFIDAIEILKEEERKHINISIYENSDIRSAFICHEALSAYELLSKLIQE